MNRFLYHITGSYYSKLLGFILLLSGSAAGQHDNAFVEYKNGPANKTVVQTPLTPGVDSIPSAQILTQLDANGAGTDSLPVGPDNIGIEEYIKQHTSLYPTTAQSSVRLEYNLQAIPEVKGQIFGTDGQLMQWFADNDGQADINISNLPVGAYLMNVQTEGGSHVYKFLKMRGAGEPQDAQQSWGKKASMVAPPGEALYNIFMKTDSGFTNVDIDTVLEKKNYVFDLSQMIEKWDTADGTLPVRTRNATNNQIIGNIPVDVEVDILEDKPTTYTYNFTTNTTGVGNLDPISTEIDTTANKSFTDPGAKMYFEWDDINTLTAADSASPSITVKGYKKGSDSTNIFNGTNPTYNLFLEEDSVEAIIGKEYIAVEAMEVDKNMNTSLPTNAIAVVTDSLGTFKDTISIDPATGKGMSANAYPHGDYLVDIGVPGGLGANGDSLKSYDDIPVQLTGVTYNRLANDDTVAVPIKVNLLPDSVKTKNHGTVSFSAAEMDEFSEQPNIHLALQDSSGFNIDPLFSQLAKDNIGYAMDSIETNSSIITSEISNTIPNNTPYDPQTASFSSHGINFKPGSPSFTTNSNYVLVNPYGINNSIGGGTGEVSSGINIIIKEYLRSIGMTNVSSRTSSLNGNPSLPTPKDYASIEIQYKFSKAVHSTGTQNVSMEYISDKNNVGN